VYAGGEDDHDAWGHMGSCEDDCEDFVTCLFETKDNYTLGSNQVKARDLTWDCLWSIDDQYIIAGDMVESTKCTMGVYAGKTRDDVEDCFADNIYGPAWGEYFGSFIFKCVAGLLGIATLIAIGCAHCRCYKPPQDYHSNCAFSWCKCCCPLAAVISVDRYQDTTAIAALFSWCGCIYTLCCWKPRGSVELGAHMEGVNNMPPANYVPPRQNNNGTVNWGV